MASGNLAWHSMSVAGELVLADDPARGANGDRGRHGQQKAIAEAGDVTAQDFSARCSCRCPSISALLSSAPFVASNVMLVTLSVTMSRRCGSGIMLKRLPNGFSRPQSSLLAGDVPFRPVAFGDNRAPRWRGKCRDNRRCP